MFCICRQFTDSATGKGYSGSVNKNKLLKRLNGLWKTKMTMQSHSKLLMQLKDHLSKAGYDKNLQIIFSKHWLDFLQRVTYSQMNALKKLSTFEFSKNENDNKTADVEKCDRSQVKRETITVEHKGEGVISTDNIRCKKVSDMF